MSASKTCPSCGNPLAAEALQGLCPECLLKAGVSTAAAGASRASRRAFVPPDPDELRAHFPQLEIFECVGQGGMGAVYRARQVALDRVVALKILPAQAAGDPDFTARFNREARALGQLSHPNIVGVHEFGQAGGYSYFVMEFVDGVNLRRLMQSGRVSPREALAIVPQVCDALQFAHDRGVVHRDIKPENILISRSGQVKIADFGLAKLIEDSADPAITGAGDVMGTPHYMAPEQFERPLEVDHRADIFSLGVVFYQMLTGELPLGRFPEPSKKVRIDVRLDEVVLRALEKEPDLRFQHASLLKSGIESVESDPAAPARPEAGPPRLWWRPVVLATAAFALGAGFLTWKANDTDLLRLLLETVPAAANAAPVEAEAANPMDFPPGPAPSSASTPAPLPQRRETSSPAKDAPPAPPTQSIAAPILPEIPANSGISTDNPRASLTQPPELLTYDSIESNPEILRALLQRALTDLGHTRARVQVGIVNQHELKSAEDRVALMEARQRGDRPGFAQIQLRMAQREFEATRTRYDNGLITAQELQDMELTRRIAQIRLEEARAAVLKQSTDALP